MERARHRTSAAQILDAAHPFIAHRSDTSRRGNLIASASDRCSVSVGVVTSSGIIVVLNGPSSAGKTTLARRVRAHVGDTVAAISIDQLFAFMHPDAKNNWNLFSALSEAAFASAVALSDAGFHVIVDTVFERIESLRSAERVFAGRVFHLVSVTCDLEELERREALRGDRRIGHARDQLQRVFFDADYALRLDTSRRSVDECVLDVARLLG
jgi:chloramphenicol 3-O phosphotransferase